jgi:flagellar L-ring protein precursor FlgH
MKREGNIKKTAGWAMLCLPLLFAACTVQSSEVKSTRFDELIPKPQMIYASGSLWQASSSGLAEDMKAHGRGDLITILISENASASKAASTGTQRASTITAGMPNLLGLEKTPLKSWVDLNNLLNASYASQFAGTGSTSRTETLTATISAKVTDVLANGNLQIEGRSSVKVNEEDQVIVLTGTVRTRDITTDNTVNSSQIADAKISYTGKGVVSDRQHPGWLMNFFDKYWPF